MRRASLAIQVRLVPGVEAHIWALSHRLRAIDRIECEAMGQTAEQALQHGLAESVRTWTALIDHQPHAMFGVVAGDDQREDGVPWFLGSDQVARHARLMVAYGPTVVATMHRHARRLCNFVSSDNRQAIRLLVHWGFTVDLEQVVVRGIAFRRFIREIK